jgi:integrase/recombinase XerD
VLRSFFKALVRAGLLLFNPAQNIEYPRRGEKLPHEILSRKDIRKILSAPDTETVYGYRDRTMIEVLYSTGVRPMEMAALTVEDVDLDEGFLRIIEGKGLKDRTLPLGEIAGRFLAEYISHVRPHLEKNGSGKRILFLTRSGRAFDRSAIHKKLKTYAERCGIEKNVTARGFRSTMATDMLRGHADIRRIQEMLGHKSLDTTQIYARVVNDDLKKVHQRTHPREKIESDEEIHYEGGDVLE